MSGGGPWRSSASSSFCAARARGSDGERGARRAPPLEARIKKRAADAGLAKPDADALLEVQGLVVAVMYERALGPRSRWGPYLDFLPPAMDHLPVYWQAEELRELAGTAAADKLAGRVQHPADAPTRVGELFEGLLLPLVEGDAALAKAGEARAAAQSVAEARRAKAARASSVPPSAGGAAAST